MDNFLKRQLLQMAFMLAVMQFHAPVWQSMASDKKLSGRSGDIEKLQHVK